MIRVLFVDDEPNVLAALRRSLRNMRDEWEMEFIEGGENALTRLQQASFDVIVSDIRMPGINGIELLKRVKEHYPAMTRLALSGHADLELALESSTIIHQFLAKPCETEILKATIQRAAKIRNILSDDGIKSLLGRIDTLPSPPDTYFEIINALDSPNSSLEKVASIIERDAGMTAKILQLANSPLFAASQPVATILRAAQCLGMDIIKSLALTYNLFSKVNDACQNTINLSAYTQHSIQCSLLAKYICTSLDKNPSLIASAAIAGMLHDIGTLILAIILTEEYKALIEDNKNDTSSLASKEKEYFGASHAEIGGYLLGLWGLPDTITEAILFHHAPADYAEKMLSPLISVYVASNLLNAHGEVDDQLDLEYLTKLGIVELLPSWQEKCRKIISSNNC